MGPQRFARERLGLLLRAALLTAGLSTYLISPDDVVWRFIKNDPHARVLEHALFGIAAALLGFALLLKVRSVPRQENPSSRSPSSIPSIVANLLQAIGIGTLLPLPGFLLLVVGDLGASLLVRKPSSLAENPRTDERNPRGTLAPLPAFRWSDAIATHAGLSLAFLSMAIFSVVLIDRVADVLFGITALVAIAANAWTFLRERS